MDLRKEAQSFIHHLQILYFEQRDMDTILQMLDDHISWLGAGADEICRSKEAARFALEKEFSEYSDGFRITKSSYETEALPGNIFIVYGSLCAVSNNPEIGDLHNHVSAVCKWSDGEMRLVHLNMSHPDENLMSGEYYVKHTANLNKEFLKRKIEKTSAELMNRNKELEALTDNIPGGVYQCLNDRSFTILNMSKSFLDLFGYTRDEVKDIFNDHFVDMIYPDDRDGVLEISKEQCRRGNTVEFEYRIQKKDGEILWILDRGRLVHTADGQETFYCLLLDITDRKKVEEELRLSLERHRVIMDQATDIIFEWDIRNDSLLFSSNWRKKFGYDPIQTDISRRIPYSDKIFGEDMPAFVKIMEDTAAGTPYSETEFRIMDIRGNKRWCRIRATTQYDGDNHPIKAVGIITDIDNDKKQKEQLMDMARKDALTGLYNKAAIQSIVEDQLRNDKKCSNRMMMIIDVDNFKSVNDTYGHLCGDSLLADIANTLKKLFRSTDYIGRIGGDEFLIFLPDVTGREAATAKAVSVQTAFERIRMSELVKGITCSIGISFGPQEADGYLKMYQEADRALYYMKGHGKSGFAFYDDFADKTSLYIDRAFSSINEKIDSKAF